MLSFHLLICESFYVKMTICYYFTYCVVLECCKMFLTILKVAYK